MGFAERFEHLARECERLASIEAANVALLAAGPRNTNSPKICPGEMTLTMATSPKGVVVRTAT